MVCAHGMVRARGPVPAGLVALAGGAVASLLLAAGLAVAAPVAGDDGELEEAYRFVSQLASRAMDGGDGLDASARRERLSALLDEAFDFSFISRFVAGAGWRTATPAQRQEFSRVFSDYALAAYIRSLSGGSIAGYEFSTPPARRISARDVFVDMSVSNSAGRTVDVSWRLRRVNGQLKIIDLYIGGFSMAAVQREEFSAVQQRPGGFGTLISVLRDKLGETSGG